MTKRPHKRKTRAARGGVEEALAVILANTRRLKRSRSIPEVAAFIELAESRLGSLEEVAERVGVSPKMLRQFQAARNLSPAARAYFERRELDSVDIASHLSILPRSDQAAVARAIVEEQLNTKDVRAISALRKRLPKAGIRDLIRRVLDSRDVVQYVALFTGSGLRTGEVARRFQRALGKDNVKAVEMDGEFWRLIITRDGKRVLERTAKQRGLTKRALIHAIAGGAN